MLKRKVDVLLGDKVVESYEIIVNDINVLMPDHDFIKLAQGHMKEGGYRAVDIASAIFRIRDAS
jgi:hypothetical protein